MAIRTKNATLIEVKDGAALYAAELYGASTDSKPTVGLANGSIFVEVDTGNIYLFNEAEASWTKLG